eukprot:9141828-Alexandrium_andersonii.AAC.1
MADCGLGRIAARTGLGRIADCTLGTLQCKDASLGPDKECNSIRAPAQEAAESCGTPQKAAA